MGKITKLETKLIRLIYVGLLLIVGVLVLLNLIVFGVVGGILFKLLVVGMLVTITTIYRKCKWLTRLIVIEEMLEE